MEVVGVVVPVVDVPVEVFVDGVVVVVVALQLPEGIRHVPLLHCIVALPV